MVIQIILFLYALVIFLILNLLTITIQRINKINKNLPFYIYVAIYMINTIVLNFIFKIPPYKSILVNLISFLLAHFSGVRLRIMGLTGQICSGKSTVARYLETKYNAKVIDLDKLNREILEDEIVKKEIRRNFGDDLFENNKLNRLKMREIIFSDDKKRKILESITHIRVFKKLFLEIIKEKLLYNRKFLFIENAILLRFPILIYLCFPIISVCCSNNAELVSRIMKRDMCSKELAINIIEKQMKLQEFIDKSEIILINNDSNKELTDQIDDFMSKLK